MLCVCVAVFIHTKDRNTFLQNVRIGWTGGCELAKGGADLLCHCHDMIRVSLFRERIAEPFKAVLFGSIGPYSDGAHSSVGRAADS